MFEGHPSWYRCLCFVHVYCYVAGIGKVAESSLLPVFMTCKLKMIFYVVKWLKRYKENYPGMWKLWHLDFIVHKQKFNWNIATLIWLDRVCGHFCAPVAELSSCSNRDQRLSKVENIYYLAFIGKVCWPCSIVVHCMSIPQSMCPFYYWWA